VQLFNQNTGEDVLPNAERMNIHVDTVFWESSDHLEVGEANPPMPQAQRSCRANNRHE
jgi:hypothetical protein